MRRIRCAEIWGGIDSREEDIETSGVRASLYSSACDGSKGGDIYYFSVCEHDMLTRVAIADVMGHGTMVAATSQWLYDALRDHMNDVAGNAILSRLNHLADEHGHKALTTGAVIAFYTSDRHFYFSYAGHHPVLVRRRGTRTWSPATLPASGQLANLPLGACEECVFEQERMPLASGDRLFLYTDGVIEAPAPTGELFGRERLFEALERLSAAPLESFRNGIVSAVRDHVGGALLHDDVTILAVEVR